jgi:hypothetical protein
MARVEVLDFDITPEIAAHMWEHRVDLEHLYEVIAGSYIVRRNRANRVAPYLLIGEDNEGRCLAVPIVPTDDPFVWRPITAWKCKASEADKLYRRK